MRGANPLAIFKELIDLFWQIGAAISAALYVLSVTALFHALEKIHIMESSPIVSTVSWMIYAIPVLIFALASVFWVMTVNSYAKQNH